jgi:hypothetical protein
MASFGIPQSRLKEARTKLPPIKISSFVDPREPWVLVPNGSLLGFFDWVPENLRVGPWSRLALPTIIMVISMLCHFQPADDEREIFISSYPSLYSKLWCYNAVGFCYMFSVIAWIAKYRSKGAIVTFTLISWTLNMARHLISTIAPFLSDHHFLLKVNHILRFPALVSASITFTVWNFVLLPYIYFTKLETKEKKDRFLGFNFKFRMVQQHVCNVIYAILNTMITCSMQERRNDNAISSMSPKIFDMKDLWYGAACTMGYGLFYTMILDRIGVHLYPVFSPRSNFVVITWCAVFLLICGFYYFWNWVIEEHLDLLNFEALLLVNFFISAICGILNSVVFIKKRKQIDDEL